MELAEIILYKTIIMVVLALIGVFYYRFKNEEELNKKLSDLVLTLFTPILLFTSFQKDFSVELLKGLLVSAILSLLSFAIVWGISKFVVWKQNEDIAPVEHIAIMYSNCGFIGIPMAQSLFGAEGVFYMTAYVALANFLLWSHGIIVMSGHSDIKSMKKVFTSPTILAIVSGIFCFFMKIRLPGVIEEPMEMIASMNTPMAMIVAGINIAQADLKKIFTKTRLYFLSIIKLLVMPAVLLVVFHYVAVEEMIKTIIILATACPSGVTGSLFALKYGKDAIYASEIFAMTTIISIITIPLIMFFCG